MEEGFDITSSVSPPPSPLAPFEGPTDDLEGTKKYTVVLKILYGAEVLTPMVSLDLGTKTAILNEAQAVYSEKVLQYEREDAEWKRTWDSRLSTVQMDGLEVDISTFPEEDLTFMIQKISNSSIPIFTVEILQTMHYVV